MNRRAFLEIGGASALAALWHERLFAQAGPVVEIRSGRIRGGIQDGVRVFRGIPYGADTAGANRFLPARRAAAVDRRARRDRVRTASVSALPPDDSGDRRCADRLGADERGLPSAERLDPVNRNRTTTGDGVVSRRRATHRLGQLDLLRRPGARAKSRRGGRDDHASAERLRAPVAGRPSRRQQQVRRHCQPGAARSRAGARVGARQHRTVRRRSRKRDDLRAVRRRWKDRDADRLPRRERAVSPRDHHEHAGGHGRDRTRAGPRGRSRGAAARTARHSCR